MPKINLLPKQVAELIAAGEVVERPASVIKELVENSIDAGATTVKIEIAHGGITYMRITDNGCGIEKDDVPTAFLRHATSKIKVENDLDSISTLGFRGEALAAISSVARIELFTKPHNNELGTHYCIDGGTENLYEEIGCPDGTTIIIRDIFYNTPARMKFLKKDVSEANAVAAAIDRISLSHPEISFKMIRDGKQTLSTSGDGKIENAVYSVLGREFASSLIKVEGENEHITVKGLTCKPVSCRATRNNQFTFLNGRLIRSGTVTAATEQAYKNSAMIGKFPGFVLYITVPPDTVDVNVHPAKTEVRFQDEHRIFDAVYVSVKNALLSGDTRPEVKLKAPVFNPFERIKAEEYKQSFLAENIYPENTGLHKTEPPVTRMSNSKPIFAERYSIVGEHGEKVLPSEIKKKTDLVSDIQKPLQKNMTDRISVDITKEKEDETPEITLIGEAFKTYIIVQCNNSVFMIDKHAAHERILFNQLKNSQSIEVQTLLSPVTVVLEKEEYDTIISNEKLLFDSGFETEDFGNSSVLVRAVPSTLKNENILLLLSELAESIKKTSKAEIQKRENLYHTVACKAAIKAGSKTSDTEKLELAKRVLLSNDIMYCPHGRPVAFEIKRHELEKQFGRIQ